MQIGEREPLLVQIRADLQRLLRAQIGDHVDRVELGDLGERRLLAVAADDVAGIDQVLAHLAVERRPDLGIAQVQLGQRDLRLGRQHVRLGARPLEIPVVDLDLRRRVLLDQRRIAAELGLGIEQRGLLQLHLRLRLLQLILVLVLLDREQKIALLDERAVLVMDLVEIALDARDQLDRVDRSGIAGDLERSR